MATNVNKIISLPLFTGLSQKELQEIATDIPLSMRHYKKGAVIASAGEEVSTMTCIMTGWYEVDTEADDHSYHFIEDLQGTDVIEPDKLFGLRLRYRATYRAITPCNVISISKDSIMTLLNRFLIVRLNYLNMVCKKTQQTEQSCWKSHHDDLKRRITQFIRERSTYPAGRKRLYIKMTQLAEELNDSRINISNALNAMADDEKIILKRGIVEIPTLQLL